MREYTINGKQYTKLDINKRCAELEDTEGECIDDGVEIMVKDRLQSMIDGKDTFRVYDPCSDWSDAGHLIDKCFDELAGFVFIEDNYIVRWNLLMNRHNCTKLVAACICFIEMHE